MSILLMTSEGIYASRDKYGRTPIVIGKKEDAFCASFESFAYINLGYENCRELGPGEIVFFTPEGIETLSPPRQEMHICSFLWVYYGYPTSAYEGINVEAMRYECGRLLARRDKIGGYRRITGYRSRRTGFRHRPRRRICQRIRFPVCPPLYQIHPHLAPAPLCRRARCREISLPA